MIFDPGKDYDNSYFGSAYPDEEFLYLGEIHNMEGHGTFLSMKGKTFRLHLENFWFVLDYVSSVTTVEKDGSKTVSVSKFIPTEE